MALIGHVSEHAPHSTQTFSSITYWVSPWEMAPTGQPSAHEPQLTQASVITYAILSTPPYGISNRPDRSPPRSRYYCNTIFRKSNIFVSIIKTNVNTAPRPARGPPRRAPRGAMLHLRKKTGRSIDLPVRPIYYNNIGNNTRKAAAAPPGARGPPVFAFAQVITGKEQK